MWSIGGEGSYSELRIAIAYVAEKKYESGKASET